MTDLAFITSLKSNAPLRRLAIAGSFAMLWAMGVYGWVLISVNGDLNMMDTVPPSRLRILSAYSTPVVAAIFFGMLIPITRQGTGVFSRSEFWLGCGFIAGGAILDLGVTFYFSPDLTEEGNPVVRVLLDSGHALPMVVAHMLITTVFVVGVFSAFWAAFLAHQPFLLATIGQHRPQTRIHFLKASTGGGHLTVRQWLFPRGLSELPQLYHGIWMVGIAIVFGITWFRYYVSLEWLGIFEPAILPRLFALATGILGTLVLYFLRLSREYHANLPADNSV